MGEPTVKLYHGDCLDILPRLEAGSVDAIIADLPYGTTSCKWDTVIPLDALWKQYKRIRADHCGIVLHCTQPFTSILVVSNIREFKYCWTWDKTWGRGHLVAKYRPMQQTEDIAVFGKGRVNYYPITTDREEPIFSKEGSRTEIMGGEQAENYEGCILTCKQPTTLLTFKPVHNVGNLHPTQKSEDLVEYLVRTYTKEGDIILDNTMGSGTTGVACVQTGRSFIGIEIDEGYYNIAKERIERARAEMAQEEMAI